MAVARGHYADRGRDRLRRDGSLGFGLVYPVAEILAFPGLSLALRISGARITLADGVGVVSRPVATLIRVVSEEAETTSGDSSPAPAATVAPLPTMPPRPCGSAPEAAGRVPALRRFDDHGSRTARVVPASTTSSWLPTAHISLCRHSLSYLQPARRGAGWSLLSQSTSYRSTSIMTTGLRFNVKLAPA